MGVGLDVTTTHALSVVVPSMGKAYFNNQVWYPAEDNPGFYINNGELVTLAAVGVSVTPDKISRNGGASLVISGAGFVNPTVYLEEPCGGAKFNCEIMSYTYETINCNLAPISSLAA